MSKSHNAHPGPEHAHHPHASHVHGSHQHDSHQHPPALQPMGRTTWSLLRLSAMARLWGVAAVLGVMWAAVLVVVR